MMAHAVNPGPITAILQGWLTERLETRAFLAFAQAFTTEI